MEANFLYIEADNFEPVAQGLIQSKSVTAVLFEGCNFYSHELVRILNSILESKANLQMLSFKGCIVDQEGLAEFQAAILSLLQPNSTLHDLEFSCCPDFELNFELLLAAVEMSPLERFVVTGHMLSRGSCLLLIGSIPKMQVKILEFDLYPSLQYMKVAIMQVIKQNGSLRTIIAKMDDSDNWLNDQDRMKLSLYSTQNQFLAQWIEQPTAVPKAACSKWLAAAQVTGPDTVFRILQALAPTMELIRVGEQRRKRRRPDFYSPS